MRKLTAGDYRVMPWKNGGGSTTELVVFPAGAGLDDFDWRASTARVAGDGPFSAFPGVDRSLAVLEGHGLILADESGEHCVGAVPFVFRGEQRIDARLRDGPVTDFNVMTRRATCSHVLELTELHGTLRCLPRSDLLLVYLARGGKVDAHGVAIDEGEGLLVDWRDEPEIELTAVEPATLCLAHITFKEAQHD